MLTEQKDTAKYVATMEAAYRNTEMALFYGLDTSVVARAGTGYPVDITMTNPNDSVTVLNGSGIKQGPAIILKVMSGDKVDLSVRYFYNSMTGTGQNNLSPTDLLGGLANGLFGITGGTHGALTDLGNSATSPLISALTGFFNDPANPVDQSKPKAYLNWMLLDNQFNYVGKVDADQQSGALQVGDASTDNGQLRSPLASGISIKKSGYLYIYLSNVTEHQDVFFDNLSINHYSGPMLEETHYYPFGLTMAGISDKALKTQYAENKYRFNDGAELQNKEFSDGSGLEMYATDFRGYDPQIGRFWQIDQLSDMNEMYSPYSFANDNPILLNDPLGLANDSTVHDSGVKPMADAVVTAVKPNCKTCSGPTVEAGPAPTSVAAPINKSSSTAATGAAVGVIALGEGAVEGGVTVVGGASVLPAIFVGAVIYGIATFPKSVPTPAYNPVGDIAVGIQKPYIPDIVFSKDKADHLKGGKQNQRDASIKRYPKDFQRWYHREYKQPGDPDATVDELKQLFDEWESLGRPKGN